MRYIIHKAVAISALAFLALIWTSCASTRSSSKRDWVLLGTERVGFIREEDDITVNKKTAFSELRFLVEDRPIRVYEVSINYREGSPQKVEFDNELQAGVYSPVIDLKGNKRLIQSVVFKYRTVGNFLKGRARLKLYGR